MDLTGIYPGSKEEQMKRILIGIGIGAAAGIIDVIPMILMKLTWDANISAFSMWLVIGFFLSISSLKINKFMEGILFSFLVLLPGAILIGWNDPMSLIPIIIMTTLLGAGSGFFINLAKTRI